MTSATDLAPFQFAPLGHPDFRKLTFRDQVHVISLYTFHREEYEEICCTRGFRVDIKTIPPAIRRITEAMALLDKLRHNATPQPDQRFGLQSIRLWAGYRCIYHRQWGPLDREVFHVLNHWVVNVRLFQFATLVLSSRAFCVWDRISSSRPTTPPAHMLILTALILTHADREGIEDVYLAAGRTKKRDFKGRFKNIQAERENVWCRLYTPAYAKLREVKTLDDLQVLAPALRDDATGSIASILAPDPSHVRIGSVFRARRLPSNCGYNSFSLVTRRLTVLNQARVLGEHVYLPIIPEFFYLRDSRFTIKDWDLLR